MGAVAATSAIGGATRQLFSSDDSEAMLALQGLTLKRVKVGIRDGGLANVILRAAARDANQDVAAFKEMVATGVEGTIFLFLGPLADSQKIGKAIGDFVNGKKTLTVSVTSKDKGGVPLFDLPKLIDDPADILSKLGIDAVAK
jgi:hypothetical protein